MKMYLLLEGRRTEKKIYRAWFSHWFPNFRQAERIEDLSENTIFMLAGMGYPQYLRRIADAVADCTSAKVDHLFICVDAEEELPNKRRSEVLSAISEIRTNSATDSVKIHVVVQDCCIETWLLGHRKLIPRKPMSARLREYLTTYDVAVLDPEKLGSHQRFLTRSQFHFDYLREVFRHHNKSFSKQNPGIALEQNYLEALLSRHRETGHISSFGTLTEILTTLGAKPL